MNYGMELEDYFADFEDQRFVFRRDHYPTYDGHRFPILELERHLHVHGIGASFFGRKVGYARTTASA